MNLRGCVLSRCTLFDLKSLFTVIYLSLAQACRLISPDLLTHNTSNVLDFNTSSIKK